MDNNIDLNLRLISEDCGIFSKAAPDVIISNIDKLQKSYTEDEVVKYIIICFQNAHRTPTL